MAETSSSLTASELHLHYLRKAEDKERQASARKAQIEAAARREMQIKWSANKSFYGNRNFDHELEQKVNSACTTDPLWKGYVADHQWFIQKAIMYGSMATNEKLDRLINALTAK